MASSSGQAISIDPRDFGAHYNLRGAELRELGRLDETHAEFVEALRFNLKLPQGLCNLGDSYDRKGRDSVAMRCFSRYLELAPKGSDAEEVRKYMQDHG